ncbi:hypothetical protein GCM10010304_63800 [Streptomyces roseoviolaceus]
MGDEADAEFVQGGEEPLHYEQDPEVSTPVLSSLTRPMHIAAWEDAQLNRTVELLTAELAQPQIGATAAVNPGRRMAGPYGRPAPGRPLEAPVSRKWDRSSSGGRQPPRHRGVRRSAAGYALPDQRRALDDSERCACLGGLPADVRTAPPSYRSSLRRRCAARSPWGPSEACPRLRSWQRSEAG